MYVLGHVGISAAAASAVDRKVDLRLAALLSILPDLIDKPVALLFPVLVHDSTRSFGHTALAALLVLAVMLLWRGRAGLVPAACYGGHLLLDRMWLRDSPKIALWPLLGPIPSPIWDRAYDHRVFLYDLGGELVGAALLVGLARRHGLFEPERWRAFLKSGRLT